MFIVPSGLQNAKRAAASALRTQSRKKSMASAGASECGAVTLTTHVLTVTGPGGGTGAVCRTALGTVTRSTLPTLPQTTTIESNPGIAVALGGGGRSTMAQPVMLSCEPMLTLKPSSGAAPALPAGEPTQRVTEERAATKGSCTEKDVVLAARMRVQQISLGGGGQAGAVVGIGGEAVQSELFTGCLVTK